MKWFKDNPVGLILIACIPLFIINLGELYVNIMEARNFITAREMLVDDHWIFTTINGEPRYQKPPLPTWLTAFSGALFGMKNLWALRLPAALAASLLAVYGYKLSHKQTQNKQLSLIGAFVLMTSFYILFSGRNGQWDIFTHAFMMGGIYFLYLFFENDSKRYKNAFLAAVLVGASFMSKGPVSLYALFLPFLIAYGFVYKFRGFGKKWLPLAMFLVVTVVLSGWWYWYTYTYDPIAVKEITDRETANWTSYNIRPFYYYWSFFTQSGIWTIPAFVGLLYPYLKNRVSNKKDYTFSLIWTLGSVVLLSVIPEKKSRYLLPVLIPMAWNTAYYLEYLILKFKEVKDRRETIPVYFNFGLIGSIGLVFPFVGVFVLPGLIDGDGSLVWYILLGLSLLITGLFILRNLIRKNIQKVMFGVIAFVMAIMCFGMPLSRNMSENLAFRPMSELAAQNLDFPIYEYAFFTPEMTFDYGKPLPVLYQNNRLNLPEASTFGVLVSKEKEEAFNAHFKDATIQKIDAFDMNPQPSESSSHKTRLARTLYKITVSQ
ncbi:MAG: glycosyltransferase family 39 protein [Gilvibacter sp.]